MDPNTHVLRSTRIEKMIYDERREQVKTGLDEVEAYGTAKLDTFPSLVQDMFMALYSLNPQRHEHNTLTTSAREFNVPLLDFVMDSDQYHTLKSLCEGRELIAYEAVNAFAQCMLEKLDELLDPETLEALNALEAKGTGEPSEEAARLSRSIARKLRQNEDAIQEAVDAAMGAAQQASDAIKSWGNSDSSPTALQQNAELLRRIQSSQKLREIIKHLGKYREILDHARKTSFIYGRGETYDIVLGKDFIRAISSEYAYLATSETVPLFMQKVQRKTLKQYRKRERVSKGCGDIVVCIDESGSMYGERIAWAKAVALVVLEHAVQNGRKCVMVRFASDDQPVTHIFAKGEYTVDDVFEFAESFLWGGTDFEAPLTRAVSLIEDEGFESADVMFITDGEHHISDKFVDNLRNKKSQLKFKVTGVLVDLPMSEEIEDMTKSFNKLMRFRHRPAAETVTDLSLRTFCESIHRVSEMTGDQVAAELITSLIRKSG